MITLSGETYATILKQIPQTDIGEFVDDHLGIPVGMSGLRGTEVGAKLGAETGIERSPIETCPICFNLYGIKKAGSCYHYDMNLNVYTQ